MHLLHEAGEPERGSEVVVQLRVRLRCGKAEQFLLDRLGPTAREETRDERNKEKNYIAVNIVFERPIW